MPANQPLVAIIVLNWNGLDDTIECLDSLEKLDYPNRRIIVVDNASSGDDVQRLEQRFGDRILIVRNQQNEGYAQGNNRGMDAAEQFRPDFFWVLNNDLTVEPTSLSELVSYSENHPRTGIIGSFIGYWNSPNIYCLGGGTINLWTGIDRMHGAGQHRSRANVPKRFDYISGAAFFLRADVYRQLGGFDPDYFLYSEEADLSRRATRAGWRTGYAPTSIVYHKFARSTGAYSPTYVYYFLRNKLVFMKKNARWWHWLTFWPVFFGYYCLGFLWRTRQRTGRIPGRIVLQSLRDFLAGRLGRQPIRSAVTGAK